jgi:NADH dehydrogenase
MILVIGGTGFVGRHFIQRLRKEGISVRVLARKPENAGLLRDLGVELVRGDLEDNASLEKAAAGAERVVHLVGIIQETRHASFQGIHVDGTRNVLDASKKAGVRRFFYLSALGTRPAAKSSYHKTKWAAEELVRTSGTPYTILRPSLIYGTGDGFTTRLSEMIRLSPFLPVIGQGRSKVQPIFIDDVVSCMVKAVMTDAFLNKEYEIGGPEQLTYEEVTVALAEALGIRRPVLHMPLALMKPAAGLLEALLPAPPVTTDQLIMLQEDNVCDMRDIRDIFGIEPVQFRKGLAQFVRVD